MADFGSFYQVLLFDKILPCKNFDSTMATLLNIFRILHGSRVSWLIIVSAAFYGYRDIKMGHSVVGAILIFFLFAFSVLFLKSTIFFSEKITSKVITFSESTSKVKVIYRALLFVLLTSAVI